MASNNLTAPTNFTVSKTKARPGDSLTFTWGPSKGLNGATVQSYQLTGINPSISGPVGEDFMPGCTVIPGTATSYTCAFPDNAYTHVMYYVVAQGMDDGFWSNSPSSETVYVYRDDSIAAPPEAPGAITVENTKHGARASISWTASGGSIMEYVLERAVNGGEFAVIYTGNSLSYSESVGDWTIVQYRVKAVSADGESSLYTVSDTKTVTNEPDTPDPPVTTSGARLEQFQNSTGAEIYPRTIVEGVFRQSDGKSLEDILSDAGQGSEGQQGPKGDKGETGATGPQGPAGPGVATGGTAGQALVKKSGTDYDTQWATLIQCGTTDLTAGSSALAAGTLYGVY